MFGTLLENIMSWNWTIIFLGFIAFISLMTNLAINQQGNDIDRTLRRIEDKIGQNN